MKEEWRDLKGHEKYFEVSNLGRVRKKETKIWNGKGYFVKKSQVLSTHYDKGGYVRVDLCFNNKKLSRTVHRLVALTFIPNPKNKPQVNHKDGNKNNNQVDNLEWVTNYENYIHAVKTGLKDNRIAAKVSAKKSSKPVKQIDPKTNKVVNVFKSVREAERQTGVWNSHISKCCRSICGHQTAGGFKWEYIK